MQKQQSFDVTKFPNSSAVMKMLQAAHGEDVALVNIDWSTATATFDVAEKKAAEKKAAEKK